MLTALEASRPAGRLVNWMTRGRAAHPVAKPQSWRRWAGLALALVVFGSASGCAAINRLLPGAVVFGTYVVNRGGHFFVGDRCTNVLTDAAVFPLDASFPSQGPPDYSQAYWHAVSSPPVVGEFELFADAQPGVTVERDTGARPLADQVIIVIRDDEQRGHSVSVVPDNIADGHVAAAPASGWEGATSWADYQAIPDSVYGC
jgi:hypothetical protein